MLKYYARKQVLRILIAKNTSVHLYTFLSYNLLNNVLKNLEQAEEKHFKINQSLAPTYY